MSSVQLRKLTHREAETLPGRPAEVTADLNLRLGTWLECVREASLPMKLEDQWPQANSPRRGKSYILLPTGLYY